MRYFLPLLAVLCVLAPLGCSRHRSDQEAGNFVHVKSDDEAMNAAIAEAQRTADDFVRAFHEHKEGTHGFFVKKPFSTPAGGVEHMWIEISGEANGKLEGVVSNEAEETQEVKMGQKVTLDRSEISDWRYQAGKKLIGGYTIRYFYDRMSPQEQADFKKEAGFEL